MSRSTSQLHTLLSQLFNKIFLPPGIQCVITSFPFTFGTVFSFSSSFRSALKSSWHSNQFFRLYFFLPPALRAVNRSVGGMDMIDDTTLQSFVTLVEKLDIYHSHFTVTVIDCGTIEYRWDFFVPVGEENHSHLPESSPPRSMQKRGPGHARGDGGQSQSCLAPVAGDRIDRRDVTAHRWLNRHSAQQSDVRVPGIPGLHFRHVGFARGKY
ncbi:hypothetical protein CEXT_445251 [Caerostris extrusa]|uniref:Uncharacterized protein n=1 Tax=Caerostris extrusa TaxID=172846 RepID=A0AAV4XEE1_CAEEX|nr:hypothetical protein CEXT_445251 [Caerostris extrusa]